jgi:hypothetical protein
MNQHNSGRLIMGVLIWGGLIVSGVVLLRQTISASPVASRQIIDYLSAQKHILKLHSRTPVILGVGDPVFLDLPSGDREPIGIITELDYPASPGEEPVKLAWVKEATIKFVSGAPPLSENACLHYRSTSESLGWVGETMFHPEKRQEIAKLMIDAYGEHQEKLLETFEPLLKQTIADSAKIIRDQITVEIKKHRRQIEEIGRRYQAEVLEKDILPVLEDEVWPIIRKEGEPLAAMVGMEIWREVSVWRFGWRYLYDATPLPERNLSRKEFDRFLERKVVPILKSHIADAVELQAKTLKKISQNEKVKATLSVAGNQFFSDPQVQSLVKEIFTNAIVKNEKLQQSIEATWRSESAIRAMQIANDRLDPVVTKIGKSLFGSPRSGVTPEFARVLRNRVLHKDQRWLILKPDGDAQRAASSGEAANSNVAGGTSGISITTLPLRLAPVDEQTQYFPTGGGR